MSTSSIEVWRRPLGVLFIALVAAACTPEPPAQGVVDTGPCVVDDGFGFQLEQADQVLVKVIPPGVEIVVDEDNGGPLRCRPTFDRCVALADCIADAVDVVVGEDVTLIVGLRTVGQNGFSAVFDISLGANPDGVFQLLEPLPGQGSSVDGESVLVFVGVNAHAVGAYAVNVDVFSNAVNAPSDGTPVTVTLNVNAVAP